MSTPAWTGRSRGTGAGYALVFWLLRLFGRRLAYLVVELLVPCYLAFAGRARRASLDWFRRVRASRGDPRPGPLGRAWQSWRHLAALARSIVDQAAVLALGRDTPEAELPRAARREAAEALARR